MAMERIKGTGKASCQICKKKILKGQAAIKYTGYMTSCQCHQYSIDCGVRK